MNIFTEIIDESRDIIRQELKNSFLSLAVAVEDFLHRERVPVESAYSDNEPYKQICYPDTNYIEIIDKIKSELIPSLEGISSRDYSFKPYIFKYIMILAVDNKALLQVTNMFYPIANYKFSIQTYQSKARFQDKMLYYVHPKYRLDLVLSRCYDPLVDQEKNDQEFHEIYNCWKKIDADNKVAQRNKFTKRMGIAEYNLVKDKVILCNHDLIYTSCLCRSDELDKIIAIIDPNRKYTVSKNSIKSLYDIRYSNVNLSIGGKTVLKLWPVLQHSMIPVVKDNKAHIDVVIHYALIDYLHHDIMAIQKVAFFKNLILNYFMNRKIDMIKKHILTRLDKCKYIGTYYPIDIYLKQHRIDKISEMIANKNRAVDDDTRLPILQNRSLHLLTL